MFLGVPSRFCRINTRFFSFPWILGDPLMLLRSHQLCGSSHADFWGSQEVFLGVPRSFFGVQQDLQSSPIHFFGGSHEVFLGEPRVFGGSDELW